MTLSMRIKDRLKATLGGQTPWVQPVLAVPFAHVAIPPTEGAMWVVDEKTLLDTLNPEKPARTLATRRIEQIVAELDRLAMD